jgi:dihydrofolate reductase
MSDVIIQMSMSLDGYISGPDDSDIDRLHQWMGRGDGDGPGESATGADRELLDELRSESGAMISGRRLYDMTHGWNGSHPFGGIPVFVVSRNIPDEIPTGSTPFIFVTDGIASAVAQAKEAAAGKNVYVIGGASIDQQLIAEDLADELRIDVVPILLGGGIPLFADPGTQQIELERTSVVASPFVTHLRFRVIRAAAS